MDVPAQGYGTGEWVTWLRDGTASTTAATLVCTRSGASVRTATTARSVSI